MGWVIGIFIVLGLVIVYKIAAYKARFKKMLEKYGDATLVRMIMKRSIWQGQTDVQLVDAIGEPVKKDQKVLKTKIRETWKYQRTGRNRFNLRVKLENGVVVGWEKKG